MGIIPQGTQYKDLLLPMLILTVTFAVSWTTFRVFEDQRSASVLIDIAGRQRMLSQRLYLELATGINYEYGWPETLASLEESARALRTEDKIRNPRAPDQWELISRPASPRIMAKLDEQIKFIEDLAKLLSENAPLYESLGIINKISILADETVQLYVEESNSGMLKILAQNIAFIIVLAILGLGLNRLIVDRKYQLEELAQAKESALSASEAKSMFLANMSHEIRTPLNAIVGMSELLQDTELKGDQKRYVEILKRASNTLLKLINDILDLSRVESGQIELDISTFYLSDLIDEVTEIIAVRAHQKRLNLICDIAPEVPKTIATDRNRLMQILMNLLSNAVKFTQAGDISLKIEVINEYTMSTSKPSEIQLKFSVSDTGIGIAQDKLLAIFENFVQADSSVSYNYGGTGLGLAISKKLVELMGGRINVKSVLGMGSTFIFSIRAFGIYNFGSINKNSQIGNLELFQTNKSFSRKFRILIVDDVLDNRFVVTSYLGNHFFEFEEASNGEEALNLVYAKPFDLIFMDMRMSPIDGYQATKEIRNWEQQKNPHNAARIPIVALTAHALKEDIDRAKLTGCDYHLTKPITKTRLSNLVEAILDIKLNTDINILDQNLKLEALGEENTIQIETESFLKPRLLQYIENRKNELLTIQEALSREDFECIVNIGHNVAGTAGIYGMMGLSELAHKLEQAAINLNPDEILLLTNEIQSYISRIRY